MMYLDVTTLATVATTLITSTPPATTTLLPKSRQELWFSLPELVRFLTSANIGNIAFFTIDQTLYELVITKIADDLPMILRENKESVCFFISYALQIVIQHFLNAFLVYGMESIGSREKYFSTLLASYSAYFISLIGSTICNAFLIKRGISKNVAFAGTIGGFGILNFLILSRLIREKDESDIKKKSNKSARFINTNVRGGGIQNQILCLKLSTNEFSWRKTLASVTAIILGIDTRESSSILAFVKSTGKPVII